MDWDDFISHLPAAHTITVEPYAGAGAYGPQYGDAFDLDQCFVDSGQRKRVRITTQDAAGSEVVSATQVYCPPGTASLVPPESRVTLPSGVVARVITTTTLDAAGLDLPEHVTLFLE